MYGSIRSKETDYGGYHFRSRIEARWAVAFDTLGVAWVYELRHYDFGRKRPWLDDEYEFKEYLQEALYENTYDERSEVISGAYRDRYEREMYLPDFYLPEMKHWVEMKGKAPTYDERSKATQLATRTHMPVTLLWGNIPDPHAKTWGECSDVYGGDMSILMILVGAYGEKAMQHAFQAARQARFEL